jgi:hypothetical protein
MISSRDNRLMDVEQFHDLVHRTIHKWDSFYAYLSKDYFQPRNENELKTKITEAVTDVTPQMLLRWDVCPATADSHVTVTIRIS